jgi:sugar lactone lactonase YvrE
LKPTYLFITFFSFSFSFNIISTSVINPCKNQLYWTTIDAIYAGANRYSVELNQLKSPFGIAFDINDNLYVSERGTSSVMKYSPNGSNGTVAAGQRMSAGSSFKRLSSFLGYLCIDSNNTLYVADVDNHRVMRWRNNASTGETVAGNGSSGSTLNKVKEPIGVWIDSNFTVLVSELANHRITKWTLNATEGIRVAGANDSMGGKELFLLF